MKKKIVLHSLCVYEIILTAERNQLSEYLLYNVVYSFTIDCCILLLQFFNTVFPFKPIIVNILFCYTLPQIMCICNTVSSQIVI